MSWAKVLLLAVVSAVITSVLLIVPSLKGTSFQDPGTYLECWFFLAIIIIVNCKKWWEASLKCFVFFLVSQPLIYLIQVPFNAHGWGIFQYYKTWFILTILTLRSNSCLSVKKKERSFRCHTCSTSLLLGRCKHQLPGMGYQKTDQSFTKQLALHCFWYRLQRLPFQ